MKITICCDTEAVAEKIKKNVNDYFFSIRRIRLLILSKEELRAELQKSSYDCDLLLMYIESKDSSDTIKLIQQVKRIFPTYQLIGISDEHDGRNYYPELFEANLLYYIYEDKLKVLLPRALKMAVDHYHILMDNCLLCKSNHQIIKIPFDDIMYIEREMHTTKIYTKDHCYMIRRKLNDLEDILAKYPALIRCHMCFFINANYAVVFGNKKFKMRNGEIIPVSRKYYQEVKDTIEERYERLS